MSAWITKKNVGWRGFILLAMVCLSKYSYGRTAAAWRLQLFDYFFLSKNLLEDLRENLDGHLKEVLVGLMYSPPAFDAHELWHAMKVILIL